MCDTLVALPPATADGSVLFAKNSDRPRGEEQSVCRYPPADHAEGARVRCTYIEIPQVPRTFGVVLSRIDWMWGAEMGANECGVVIGNEAVWTKEPLGPPALLGMDLVRLGLERAATAADAVGVITGLLETHGQGGACAEGDPAFAYHNGFLIADRREAWVLETAGRAWAAERVASGVRNISNALTIRTGFDRGSPGLAAAARRHGHHGSGAVDFAGVFSLAPAAPPPNSRQACGRRLLERGSGGLTAQHMMAILRDHDSGICMHGSFETTAAMVSRLTREGAAEHWFTAGPYPCRSPFVAYDCPARRTATV